MASILGLGKFSTLIGAGTAVTVTIGGGYLVVKKAKKATQDISVVDTKEEMTFTTYDVGDLNVDSKINSAAEFIDKIIKINEKNMKMPAGTSFSDVGEINSNLLDNFDSSKNSNMNFDQLKEESEALANGDSLIGGQEEAVVSGDDNEGEGEDVNKSSDDENNKVVEGTEQPTDSNSENKTQTSGEEKKGEEGESAKTETKTDTNTEAAKDSTQSNADNSSGGDNDATPLPSGDSKNSSGQQEQRNLAIENLISQLKTKMSDDADFKVIEEKKDQIAEWLKSVMNSYKKP